MFAKNSALAPAMQNYGNIPWTNAGDFSESANVNSYLVEAEGIYTGYRYYETRYADIVLGNGPALCNSPIATKQLNEKMVECAQRAGIGIQREAASSRSFTDADQIHFSNKGVPVVFTGIPLRNMHNPGEVADMKDVEGCIELIAEFLCGFK